MAVPMTSARSQAQMATSQASHCAIAEGRDEVSRHACAKSIPVTMPSRVHNTWRNIAIKLESRTIQSSE